MVAPERLNFERGYYPTAIKRLLNLEFDELVFRYINEDSELIAEGRIRPSPRQWQTFRDHIDRIDVWSWEEHYPPYGLDGESWSLEIEFPDRRMSSGGSNNYPGDAPGTAMPSNPSRRFYDFLRAIDALLVDFRLVEDWDDPDYEEDDE